MSLISPSLLPSPSIAPLFIPLPSLQKELDLYVDKNGTVLDLLREAYKDVSKIEISMLDFVCVLLVYLPFDPHSPHACMCLFMSILFVLYVC